MHGIASVGFNPDGTPTMSNNTSYNITLIDSATQHHHTIIQLPIDPPPFKYLGSESILLGTTKHQFNSSIKHALRGARIISSSKLNRFRITLYLKTHLHPKLAFPLNCTFLIIKQYNSIQNKYNSLALSSMGYNHTWPVALRFGYYKYCGLRIRHLELDALIRKLQHLQLLFMKPDTSKLIITILA